MQRLADYYTDKTILLTGATGFVGKAVLEKLLHTLPEVARICVLIRPGRGADGSPLSAQARLHKEVLANSVFDALRAQHGEAGFEALVDERLEVLAGDVSQTALGLDEAAHARLADAVDIVINCAALAVFDGPLDQLVRTNALGPANVLEFAHASSRSPFVAHVSTCYVTSLSGPIFERPPRPGADDPADPAGRFDVDAELDALTDHLGRVRREVGDGDARGERMVAEGLAWARRRGWHDTYTFTKALGEQVFTRRRGGVPGLILRPSIIESAREHPAPGWIDGFRMADPLIVGYGRGQIFEFPGNPSTVVDVVPVDRVVNALLAAIPWSHRDGGPDIYQVASGMDNPLRLQELYENVAEYFRRKPLRRVQNGTQGRPLPTLTFPDVATFLDRIDRRYVPALRRQMALYGLIRSTPWGRRRHAMVAGRLGRLQRLRDMASIYGPYVETRMRFLTYNTHALAEAMSPEDRARYPVTAEDIDWRQYLQEVHIPGIERNLLRMSRAAPESAPAARSGSTVGAAARSDNPATAAAAGGEARAQRRWHTAEQLLAATRPDSPEAVARWLARGRRFGLQNTTLGLFRLISRAYLGLEVHGRERVPDRGPFILVSNHCSHADTGILLAAMGAQAARVHPIAAADYWFHSRLVGWLLHGSLAAVPFDRRATSVQRALALPAEVLRQGDSLIFYPEGTRSLDGKMQKFRSTVGLLALAADAPIVPAHIAGTTEVLRKGQIVPRPRRVAIRFGQPIRVGDYLGRLDHMAVAGVARELARDAQAAVESLAPEAAVERSPVSETEADRASRGP